MAIVFGQAAIQHKCCPDRIPQNSRSYWPANSSLSLRLLQVFLNRFDADLLVELRYGCKLFLRGRCWGKAIFLLAFPTRLCRWNKSRCGSRGCGSFRIVAGSSVGFFPREIIISTPSCEENLFCSLI